MRPGALVLTFDNLGEASELERGTWPADAPTGRHPSVTIALPRLLDELDAHELTPSSPSLLREAGLRWCSPAGGEFGVRDGLVYVPFQWPLVDAYHLMARFSELRVSRGEGAQALAPGALAQRLAEDLDALARAGGARTLILHPFLMVEESWWAGVRRLLALIGELARGGRLRVVPGGRFAHSLHRDDAE